MKKVNCIKCGIIDEYEIIDSPDKYDSVDFKYSRCKCGSEQPLCFGKGCFETNELSCKEFDECMKILESHYAKRGSN